MSAININNEKKIREQLTHSLDSTEFSELGEKREGKVRDTYASGDKLYLIATDRLSAFDRVLTTIPFKGEVLTRMAAYWFDKTRDIIDNHILDIPDPSVMAVRKCDPLPVEVIVRGYITGSLWRDYGSGDYKAYGLSLPGGLRADQRFDSPIITPTTKAAVGEHDMPVSREKIIADGMVDEDIYSQCEKISLELFSRGVIESAKRGLILVDTKYEFGMVDGRLCLMDEIHTPDSSRYWIADGYEERFRLGKTQKMLDKENIRQWLIQERNYMGEGPVPEIPDDVRVELSSVYLDVHRLITGEDMKIETGSVKERIRRNLQQAGYL